MDQVEEVGGGDAAVNSGADETVIDTTGLVADPAMFNASTVKEKPPAVVGVGIGIVNGAGNLGGTVGPYFFGFVRESTGSFALALTAAGVALVLGSLVAMPIRQRNCR